MAVDVLQSSHRCAPDSGTLTCSPCCRSARKQADAVWMKSPLYPSYYMNSFHYQTDGWLSPSSASVYESSTETLFLGRQDAMQVVTNSNRLEKQLWCPCAATLNGCCGAVNVLIGSVRGRSCWSGLACPRPSCTC